MITLGLEFVVQVESIFWTFSPKMTYRKFDDDHIDLVEQIEMYLGSNQPYLCIDAYRNDVMELVKFDGTVITYAGVNAASTIISELYWAANALAEWEENR